MTDNEILELKLAKTTTHRTLHIAVMHVQKCNFNDTFYIHTEDIPLSSFDGKAITWFDPYFGKGKGTDVTVAVAYADDRTLYVFEKRGEKLTVHKKGAVSDVIITDPNDQSTFIASHMYMA